MSEPTSALSTAQIITRIAEEAGNAFKGASGQEKATVPMNEYDLDKCLRVANDALDMFINDAPREGWRWRKRIMQVTFAPAGDGADNIDSDPARYLLSEDFGEPAGQIKYAASSKRGHILQWRSEAFIRANRETSVQTGYPKYAATRPYGTRRTELIVDPQPSAADTIEFPYMVGQSKFEMVSGIATVGAATTLTCGAIANQYIDDYFNDWVLTIVSGTGRTETATITDYDGTVGQFTFAALSGGTTPDTTSYFYVEPANNKHPAGFEFDGVFLAACLAQAEMQFKDVSGGYVEKYYGNDLLKAYEKNGRMAPRKLGYIDRRLRRTESIHAGRQDVTYNTG